MSSADPKRGPDRPGGIPTGLLAAGISALLSALVALVIWWFFLDHGDSPGSGAPVLEFYSNDQSAFDEMADEVRKKKSGDPLGRTRIPPELAERIFHLNKSRNTYDEHANYINKPNWESKRVFHEHPDKGFVQRTNSLGLRRNSEVTTGDIDLRVLVAGDSHLDGMCNNAENLCAIAESALRAERPDETIEVLNAGRGGYHLWNYAGTLERFLHLDIKPDVFVVMVFGGNDFSGTIRLSHLYDGTEQQGHPASTRANREKAFEDKPHIMGQGYNSLLYFRDNPNEALYSLKECARITRYIAQLCEENEIELLYLYLPAPLSLKWEKPYRGARLIRELLEIKDSQRDLNQRIAERFLADLEAASIPHIDLSDDLGDDPAKHFWNLDLHLNVEGHRVVGGLLAEALRDAAPK